MSMQFIDLQNEVLRRATRNQSGGQFTSAVKNLVNTSIQRISRDGLWRALRRKATVATEATYTTGTGKLTATNGSNSFTISSGSLITDGIEIGRRISIQGSTQRYIIQTIPSNTTFTTNLNYDGTSIAGTGTFTIYGREEYNLPIQAARIALVWHEGYGYPFVMGYQPDVDFYRSGVILEIPTIPVYYRMWGADEILKQPTSSSVMTISSSSSADTAINVRIFGIVSGYPDFEQITTNSSDGTTAVAGTKSFTSVERVIADSTNRTGRITVTSNSANNTVAVIPVGSATRSIRYQKMQIWPLPNTVFNINVQYYKEPWYLVNDNDEHELGQAFDEAIILLATAKVNAEENKAEADRFFGYYQDELKNLRKTELDILPNWVPTLRRPRVSRFLNSAYIHRNVTYTQLGGNFGPMTS